MLGVGLMFASNGAVFSSLLPWYPLTRERLDLSATEFGFIVAAFAVGALMSSAAPAPLIRRFGTARVSVITTAVLAVAIAATGWTSAGWMLAGCILVIGFFDATADAAQNVAGVRVQERFGRPILGSMHALWSLGAVAGGGLATLAASVGADMRVHLAISSVLCLVLVGVGAALTRSAAGPLAEKPRPEGAPQRKRLGLVLRVVPLGLLAIAGTAVEDIANNWAGIAGVEFAGLDARTAGVAFTIIIASQCIGRFSGDALIHRFGRRTVAQIGGVLVTIGGIGVVISSDAAVLFTALGLVGFGTATIVPSAFSAAAEIPGVSEDLGVTVVGWLMRVGFLATSPLVGLTTDAFGLRTGLMLITIIGVATFALSWTLQRRTRTP